MKDNLNRIKKISSALFLSLLMSEVPTTMVRSAEPHTTNAPISQTASPALSHKPKGKSDPKPLARACPQVCTLYGVDSEGRTVCIRARIGCGGSGSRQ